jgi:hypothetical protein
MASRTFSLHCDVAVKDIVTAALREYAYAAYPEGGSECAQVARYTLLQAVDTIEAGIRNEAGEVQLSRRLRTQLKAALDYHFDRHDVQSGASSLQQRACFAELLKGSPLSIADLNAAQMADQT